MACLSMNHVCFSGSDYLKTKSKTKGVIRNLKIDFMGKLILQSNQVTFGDGIFKTPVKFLKHAQSSIWAMRWWEKTIIPNMVEIHSAQELVDSLRNAAHKLVVVNFYAPSCGGCKALHPKICQIAESHPNAVFLKVNHEDLQNMCHCLNIHVVPFFKFYRGEEGHLCSFSCTNATVSSVMIHKLKNALAKHEMDGYCISRAKGLNESELQRLVSVGVLSNESAKEQLK